MFGRRPVVLLLVASLLASLGAVVPTTSRTALGNGGGGGPRTWTIGPGDATSSCGSVDFQVGVAGDGSAWAAIQAAVDVASTGDTIYLCNDTYDLTTGIDLAASPATFVIFRGESTTGAIVDGGDAVQLFYGGPVDDVAFVGLTLQNGSTEANGGAVDANEVSVHGAVFRDNGAGGYGGAIEAAGAVEITDGTFIGNAAQTGAGAVDANTSIVVRGGIFRSNSTTAVAGAVYVGLDGDFADVLFEDNTAGSTSTSYGGAISARGASVVRGVFRRNIAGGDGGAIFAYLGASISDGTFEGNRGDSGGAISSDYDVSVTDGVFIGNRAAGNGGAIEALNMTSTRSVYHDNSCGTGGQNQDGGAIIASYSITSVGDEFVGNVAPAKGGAIKSFGNGSGTVAVIAGTFSENTAGSGGAIDAGQYVVVEITGGSFARNRATLYGGGAVRGAESVTVDGADFTANTAAGGGGAIAAGFAKVTRGSYRDNSAGDGGAILANGVEVSGATFAGNSAVTNNGAIGAGGAVTAIDSTFVDNTAGSSSGAIGGADAVTLRRSHFLRNRAVNGDAGAVYAGGAVTVEGTDMTSNTAGNDGGAVFAVAGGTVFGGTFVDNSAGMRGGAIRTDGLLEVSDGTYPGNRAGEGGAIWSSSQLIVGGSLFRANVTTGRGGAIWASRANQFVTGLVVRRSTFVDNSAGAEGGGVFVEGTYSRFLATTFVDNLGDLAGAPQGRDQLVIYYGGGVKAEIRESLFAGAGCINASGMVENNLSTSASCPGGVVARESLRLGELANHGGPTATVELLPGSIAIDPPMVVPPCATSTDQRGLPKPRLGTCDVGAFEFQGPVDRTTGITLRAFAGGVELSAGSSISTGDAVTVVAYVSLTDGSDADLTAGQVMFEFCTSSTIGGACESTYPRGPVAVTDGTTGGDLIGEASYLFNSPPAGWYRLAARFEIPGGIVGSSEVTTGTSFRVVSVVAVVWDATAGVVQTTGSVPLRAATAAEGGALVSGCPVTFTVSDVDGSTIATRNATTVSGVAATTVTGLSVPGLYLVAMTTGDACTSAMPAWGVLTVGPTTRATRSTIGGVVGGKHFFAGQSGNSASFGLRVDSTSGAIAKGSKTIGYRTNARFIWVSSDGWRLTAFTTGDYTTGAGGPFTKPSCSTFSASDGVTAGAALPSRGYVCGQFVFRGTLQQWSGGTWGAGTEVAFTARIADGGATRGVDNTDWFGLQLAGGAPSIESLRPLRIGTTATYLGRAFVY